MASRSAFAMYVPTVEIPVASIPSKTFNGQTGQALAATTSGLLSQVEAGFQARADAWAGKAVTGLGAAMAARVQETEEGGVPEGFTQSLQEDFKRQVEALRKEMPPYARNTFELGARNVWNRVTAYTLPAEEAAKAERHTATVHEAIDNLSAAAARGIGDLPSLLRESGAIIGGAKLPEAERRAAVARAHGRIVPLYIMGLARRGGFEHAFQVLGDGTLEKVGVDPRVINSIREVLKAEQRRQKRAKSAVRSVALVRGLSEGLRRAAAVRDGHATMFDLPDVEAFEAEFGRAASRGLRQAVEETVRQVEERSKAIDEVAKRVVRGERIEPKDADGFDFFWSEHLAPQLETLPEDTRRQFTIDAVNRAGRVPQALKRDIIAAFKSGDHAAIAGNVELLEGFGNGEEVQTDFLDGPEREMFEGVSALRRAGHSFDGAVKRFMEGLELTPEKREARGRAFDRLMRLPGALEILKDDLFNALKIDRPGGLELDESETGARGQTLPWDGQRDAGIPLQSGFGRYSEPVETAPADEAPWRSSPSSPGDGAPRITRQVPAYPKPKPVLLPGIPRGYQPGDWYNDQGATTGLDKVLVPASELSPRQQANLQRRRWMHPTGQTHGNQSLTQGMGYFGASRREGTKVTYHGGIDCPGTTVRMPTDAELVEVVEMTGTDEKGNPFSKGYMLVFDLGDGLQMSLLHVRPNERILALKEQLDGRARFVRPLRIRMGEVLGEVDTAAYDGRNDHTHMQIITSGGAYNGRSVPGFAVDPTPFVEKDGEPVLETDGQRDDLWDDFQDFLRRFGLT
ncbi:MAG: hypothetical protein KBA31_19595 [Alphaproteobacteria bacterium]|nr:hypothetical protein [Alphaproteobacteria bacterium]